MSRGTREVTGVRRVPLSFQVVDHEINASTHVVEFQGELDLYTAPGFGERLHEVIDAGKSQVVVDLSRAPFIDSTGLVVLVADSSGSEAEVAP
jgi:anti-anti-sigma factor